MRSEPLDASADLSVVRGDLDDSVVRGDLDDSVVRDSVTRPDDVLRRETDSDLQASAVAAEQKSAAAGEQAEQAAAAAPAVVPRRPGRVSRFFAEVPLALVIAGVGAGLTVIAMHHFRWGSLAISASVLVGGIFRLVLPARKAGLLVVRSRFTDVIVMGFLGGALMVLAAVTST